MSDLVEKKQEVSVFSNTESFENAQRVAKMLSSSDMVPKRYQNNVQNTMIALEMAYRTKSSPLMVMQNLDIIQGKPSWSSQFIIAALNSCGRFTPLKFVYSGTANTDDWSCHAEAKSITDGQMIKGPTVTIKMAKAEGWLTKGGSKWKTMPELMMSYRSAAFFGRLHAPDILQGMHSNDEIVDIASQTVSQEQNDINSDFTPHQEVEDDGELI